MAKPNYSFEKRQRELAKKKKKEEKLAEKNARKTTGGQPSDDFAGPADSEAPSDAGDGGTPAEGQPPQP